METETYRLNGCNRGGRDHAVQLVEKVAGRGARSLAVELIDPKRGRAAALAPVFASHGLPVSVHEQAAPLAGRPGVDVYAVDEIEVPNSVVRRPIASPVVEIGFIVSVPTIQHVGGIVVGVVAVLTPEDRGVQVATRDLLGHIAGLVPERHSSALMAAHTVHAEQMPRVRYRAHDHLASQSARFLTTGRVEPELALIDGFTQTKYPIDVVQAQREMSRRELREVTLSALLPRTAVLGETHGVVFHDPAGSWLYAVLARRRTNRWAIDRTIELPVTMVPDVGAEPVEVPMFVTD